MPIIPAARTQSARRGRLRTPGSMATDIQKVLLMSTANPSASNSAPAEPQEEFVLCVPTSLFASLGAFQGFSPDYEHYLPTLLDPANTSFQPRSTVESDPTFKQIIPYCIFVHNGEVFYYRRGGGGEGRLLKKRSVGIGGHISSTDSLEGDRRYLQAMRREIEEEVYVGGTFQDRCAGLINDDSTEVGQVHLGIVHIFELEAAQVRPREQSILETGFAKPADLVASLDEFETWSQICLKSLFA